MIFLDVYEPEPFEKLSSDRKSPHLWKCNAEAQPKFSNPSFFAFSESFTLFKFFFSIWLKFWRHEATMKVGFLPPDSACRGQPAPRGRIGRRRPSSFSTIFCQFFFHPFHFIGKTFQREPAQKNARWMEPFLGLCTNFFLILNFKIVKKVLIWNYLFQQWRCLPPLPLCPSARLPDSPTCFWTTIRWLA